ncbi:MAG: hypothetical protein EHM48_02780 [Planctomycetaceae bacterium]|nr:MAG: hypothetical protein EHM48_02780 [Planctomycetaceae bacterium]
MTIVKLSEIKNGLDSIGDEVKAYLDTQTGKVIVVMDDELSAAEDGDELDELDDWQREAVEQAKAIQAGEGSRYLCLPDKFDINEWEMMESFALSVENEEHSDRLQDAIHGSGAFRRFKSCAHHLGLIDDWYKFRDNEYRQKALDWCEAHDIKVDTEA